MIHRIVLLVFLGLLYNPIVSFSQDSIPLANDLTEEKELKFQEYFFKALSEKSIRNYQKSIENLESCNQIMPNKVSVFFEFSKNYLLLNKPLEAKEYIDKALEQDANNIWLLKHLAKIFKLDKNYTEAIKVQKRIVKQNHKEREDLVRLYFLNKDYKSVISEIESIEKEHGLSSVLRRLKDSLENRKSNKVAADSNADTSQLIQRFKTDKSYGLLEKILYNSQNEIALLLEYSEEGISLFPAQPLVYLMKAKALNAQQSYKKSLVTLQNGIDFVFEEQMEAKFYEEMANAYKGLGNLEEEKKYRLKSKQIKN